MEPTICPYCGNLLTPKSTSRDHIFMSALGGKAIVPACRPCNSKLGYAVEGPLLKSNQLLNLLRLAAGTGGRGVPGILENGREVTWDPRSEFLDSKNPIQRQEKTLLVTGSPDQVRAQLSRMHIPPERINKYVNDARVEQVGGQNIALKLRINPALWARFTAKAALGAGYSAAPEYFACTEVAESLRNLCNGRNHDAPTTVSADMRVHEQLIQEILEPIIPGYKIDPLMPQEQHHILFIPQGESTICIAGLKSIRIFGIMVPGSIQNWTGMPVVVTDDGSGGLVSRYVESEVRKALFGRTAKDGKSRGMV